MRAGVVVATFVVLVSACTGPGPTATPIAATTVPATAAATVQATSTPTTQPTADATPSPAPSPPPSPTIGHSTLPPPRPTITFEVPPPIDEPTSRPTPTPSPTAPPTPAPTRPPPAADAPVLEGACLTFTNQPKGDFERSLLVDLSFEEGGLDGVEVEMSNTNGGEAAAAIAVLPGLWQAQLGVNGQRLAEGSTFVLATVDDARGSHDLLPQLAEALGTIPSNFRPGQSIGNSCGGF